MEGGDTWGYVLKMRRYIFVMDNELQYKNASGSNISTGLTIADGIPYMITSERYDSGGAIYKFNWTVERLDTNVVVTALATEDSLSAQSATLYLGQNSSTFSHVLGHMAIVSGNTTSAATEITTVQTWMKAKYDGATTTTIGYTYSKQESDKIMFKRDCPTVSTIDFAFKDESGTLIAPSKGFVQLEFIIPRN